jgi:large subunit ribosomal protein L40
MDVLRKTLYPPLVTFLEGSSSGGGKKGASEVQEEGWETQLHETSKVHPATPTGTYRPGTKEKLEKVLSLREDPTGEAHRTITRAGLMELREERDQRRIGLEKKMKAMVRACEKLRVISESGTSTTVKKLYEQSNYKPDTRNKTSSSPLPAFASLSSKPFTLAEEEQLKTEGGERKKKLSLAERKYYEARVEGLFPREMKVPRDTWGNGPRWDYDWKKVGA